MTTLCVVDLENERENMEKVVSKGIKIDLHIHSEYSKNKDGQKVAENTLNNLAVLVNGLVENEVTMCAITEHDTFNYELYAELKKEELKSNCIWLFKGDGG